MAVAESVAEMLEHLLLADEAPARCDENLLDAVTQLQSKILEVGYLFSHGDEERFNSAVLRTQFTNKFQSQIQRMKEMISPGENKMLSDESLGVASRKQFLRLLYDIEDAVQIGSHGQRKAAASKWKLGREICCLSSFVTTRKLKLDLDVLTAKVNSLEADARRSLIQESESFSNQNRILQSFPPSARDFYRSKYLDAENLKSFLVGGETKLSVLAIYGMGGIGKTTLASFLTEDRSVRGKFGDAAWASVSMKYPFSSIAESLLSQVKRDFVVDENTGRETVMERLYKSLYGRRYLIVLDGVWSTKVWHAIRQCFPENGYGSRIIITTRNKSVAERIGRYTHQVLPLDGEESWDLFRMTSGMSNFPENATTFKAEEVCMKIVRQCGGLPLRIKSSITHLKRYNVGDWGKVLPSLKRDIDAELVDAMGESYDELPFDLKRCFLSLGYFPPDRAITVEKLYLWWMAQGLISKKHTDNPTQMEVAEYYFNELVERSLISEVEEEEVSSSYKRFKSFKVHDLMHDLCISKGKEEGFLEVVDHVDGNREKSLDESREKSLPRHVAIYLDEFECFNDVLLMIPEPEHIRSVIFFGTDKSMQKPTRTRKVSNLKHFRKTRILEFNGVHFGVWKLPRGIEKLMYLRYLSFQECFLSKFPSSFFDTFSLLETLDLRVRVSCEIVVPWNALTNLTRLRHLLLPLAFKTDTKGKLKLNTLKKLEILVNFHAGTCDADDLVQLVKLQVLKVIVDGDTKELENTINAFTGSSVSIRYVSIEVKRFDSYSKKRYAVMESLLLHNGFYSLEIEGYLGSFLCPKRIISSNFTRIVFNGSEFDEDPMPILGKLPNLRSLVLCDDAFGGKEMVCSCEGFPELVTLKLSALRSLQDWEIEAGAMRKLTTLTIERCNKLNRLSSGLVGLQCLEALVYVSMPEAFEDEVMKIKDEMEDCGIHSVKFINAGDQEAI